MDLAGVDYISAVGLRVLLVALKKQRRKQGELKLASLQPFVKEVFDVTDFITSFPIHANREEAIRSMPPYEEIRSQSNDFKQIIFFNFWD